MGFSVLLRADAFTSFLVFLPIAGGAFAVITCTKSFVVASLRLSPPNVAGASACALAPALNVIKGNALANARKIGRLRTSARYAGNQKPWQAFFSIKSLASGRVPARSVQRAGACEVVSCRENNPAHIRAEDRNSDRGQ